MGLNLEARGGVSRASDQDLAGRAWSQGRGRLGFGR